MTDTEVQAPKIEFPCERYPIKVIGEAGEDFAGLVVEVIQRHAPGFDVDTLVVRDSRNGRFLSVQVLITATGIEQLQAIHGDLKATGRVHMVL
jgi:putative lipoic acid-binding regulatory protein